MTITDAQAHIWEPETPERPWPAGGRSFAHGDQYTVDQLLAEMAGAGIDQVVLVPPSFEGDRNDACLAAAAKYPDKFRVMGRITLTDPASRGLLATWREQPGMLGIRLSFSRGASDGWLSDGTADWVWDEAEAGGVPIMVFAPDKLELVDEIAAAHPDLRLVMDHAKRKGRFEKLELSYVPGPGCPEAFYLGLGFRHTGRLNDGEVVLELPLGLIDP